MINSELYRKYLNQYVKEAIENSDGTNPSIAAYLWGMPVASGFLTRNKDEKNRALEDARRAFDEHRHWPLQVVLSHLGIEE